MTTGKKHTPHDVSNLRSVVAIAAAAALAAPSLAAAQHRAAPGHLMTAFVPPRHIKLGLAVLTPFALHSRRQLAHTRGIDF
jgi:hypothetical protein